jgi:hypothetical protein
MIEAMHKTLGNVTSALKLADVGKSTYYDWLREDKEFTALVDDTEEYTFDFVESKIMKQIEDDNTTMIIFYAKTKMKSRGYIERSELAVSQQPAFVVNGEAKGISKILKVIDDHNANTG